MNASTRAAERERCAHALLLPDALGRLPPKLLRRYAESYMTIRVGLVAPTMDILGGHAVQAERMLEAWRGDRDIEMRLLPINPPPGRATARLSRIRFVRTLLT